MRKEIRLFIEALKEEVRDKEMTATGIEQDAQQYGQIAAFAPYVAGIRAQANETRALIAKMESDPAICE